MLTNKEFATYLANYDGISPQSRKVAKHLATAGSITAVEANAVHCIRSVSRRITELRDRGLGIVKEHKRDVNAQRYVRYVLAD